MAKKVLNYSAVVNRKEKIYSFGNFALSSQGIDFDVFKWVLLGLLLGIIVGSLLCLVLGWKYWGSNFSLTYTLITLGGGGLAGFALYQIRLGGYQLYQYLIGYFRKKQVYRHTSIKDIQTLNDKKIKTLVRKEV